MNEVLIYHFRTNNDSSSGVVATIMTMNTMSALLLFIMAVLPIQLVMSGYQQIRTQTAEVNFNGRLFNCLLGRFVLY